MAKKASASTGKKREYVVVTHGMDYWQPKPKEVIEGTFIELMKKFGGKFGEKEMNEKTGKMEKCQTYGVIKTEDGKQVGMPSSTVLNKFLGETENGKYVRITFLGKKLKAGKKKGEANSEYNDYLTEREA